MGAKHTATPFDVWSDDDHYSDRDEIYIAANPTGRNGGMRKIAMLISTHADAKANAAFIVRACNAHDEMVKALGAAQSALRSFQYGNASVDLAKDMADNCATVLAKASA